MKDRQNYESRLFLKLIFLQHKLSWAVNPPRDKVEVIDNLYFKNQAEEKVSQTY